MSCSGLRGRVWGQRDLSQTTRLPRLKAHSDNDCRKNSDPLHPFRGVAIIQSLRLHVSLALDFGQFSSRSNSRLRMQKASACTRMAPSCKEKMRCRAASRLSFPIGIHFHESQSPEGESISPWPWIAFRSWWYRKSPRSLTMPAANRLSPVRNHVRVSASPGCE